MAARVQKSEDIVTKLETVPMPRVQRSFDGIRSALFDEWDSLRSGNTTADNAKAASRMADVILKSVETQLETLKFSSTHSQQAGLLLK
jgi:hypothetical protein